MLTLVAGGSPFRAMVLGAGMTCLQFGIGAVNDLVDAPTDAHSKPGKPIPAGLVRGGTARVVAALAFAGGLVLSALSGPLTLLVAVLVSGVGLTYDLVLKGTSWSWTAFAIGIPLLPVYAWIGATGTLPIAFSILLPAAVAAGVALAVANGLVDLEGDRAAGVESIVVRLGRERAVRASRLLHGGVAVTALLGLAAFGGRGLALAVVAAGIALVQFGIAFSASIDVARRERGWELEAVGVGLLAVGWLVAIKSGGAL